MMSRKDSLSSNQSPELNPDHYDLDHYDLDLNHDNNDAHDRDQIKREVAQAFSMVDAADGAAGDLEFCLDAFNDPTSFDDAVLDSGMNGQFGVFHGKNYEQDMNTVQAYVMEEVTVTEGNNNNNFEPDDLDSLPDDGNFFPDEYQQRPDSPLTTDRSDPASDLSIVTSYSDLSAHIQDIVSKTISSEMEKYGMTYQNFLSSTIEAAVQKSVEEIIRSPMNSPICSHGGDSPGMMSIASNSNQNTNKVFFPIESEMPTPVNYTVSTEELEAADVKALEMLSIESPKTWHKVTGINNTEQLSLLIPGPSNDTTEEMILQSNQQFLVNRSNEFHKSEESNSAKSQGLGIAGNSSGFDTGTKYLDLTKSDSFKSIKTEEGNGEKKEAKCLSKLALTFVEHYGNLNTLPFLSGELDESKADKCEDVHIVEGAAELLDVHVRRVYELIKIIEVVSLLSFTGGTRGKFVWKGTCGFITTLGEIQGQGLEKYPFSPLARMEAEGYVAVKSPTDENEAESELDTKYSITDDSGGPLRVDVDLDVDCDEGDGEGKGEVYNTTTMDESNPSSSEIMLLNPISNLSSSSNGSSSNLNLSSSDSNNIELQTRDEWNRSRSGSNQTREEWNRSRTQSQSSIGSLSSDLGLDLTLDTPSDESSTYSSMDSRGCIYDNTKGITPTYKAQEDGTMTKKRGKQATPRQVTKSKMGGMMGLPPQSPKNGSSIYGLAPKSPSRNGSIYGLAPQSPNKGSSIYGRPPISPKVSAGSMEKRKTHRPPALSVQTLMSMSPRKALISPIPSPASLEDDRENMLRNTVRKFLMLFLVGLEAIPVPHVVQTLVPKEDENEQTDAYNKRNSTKIRRIYDVSNVLVSLGIMRRMYSPKRPPDSKESPVLRIRKMAKNDVKMLVWNSFPPTTIRDIFLNGQA